MRLSHPQLLSPTFMFADASEIVAALGNKAAAGEADRIHALVERGLPPITSHNTLAVLIGVNPGFVWSMINRQTKHYRQFTIPKGARQRWIRAPKVGLKFVQRWIAFHLANIYEVPEDIFGFVAGRNHIQASLRHTGCDWAFSVDIRSFFESTPAASVVSCLKELGYDDQSALVTASLLTFAGRLPQGSPASPVISNIVLRETDEACRALTATFNGQYSRYADDLVFSGSGAAPDNLLESIEQIFAPTPWELAPNKIEKFPSSGRIKIHGLLVKNEGVRLTKGYRNRIRAYRHIAKKYGKNTKRSREIFGHLNFANQVAKANEQAQVVDISVLNSLRQGFDRADNSSPKLNKTDRALESLDRSFQKFRKWIKA